MVNLTAPERKALTLLVRRERWLVERFCILPEQNAAFVHAMEDVLEVYHRAYDPSRPQVCLDETSKQLLELTRVPIPPSPGVRERSGEQALRDGQHLRRDRAPDGQ